MLLLALCIATVPVNSERCEGDVLKISILNPLNVLYVFYPPPIQFSSGKCMVSTPEPKNVSCHPGGNPEILGSI